MGVLSEEVVRKPKLFFVSTSATTSVLQTASICYVSTAAYATCSGRKRRAITAFSEMETEVQPKQDEVDSSLQEAESGGRDGRFLLIGSPPPPSLPPPLTLSHIQFQA